MKTVCFNNIKQSSTTRYNLDENKYMVKVTILNKLDITVFPINWLDYIDIDKHFGEKLNTITLSTGDSITINDNILTVPDLRNEKLATAFLHNLRTTFAIERAL